MFLWMDIFSREDKFILLPSKLITGPGKRPKPIIFTQEAAASQTFLNDMIATHGKDVKTMMRT